MKLEVEIKTEELQKYVDFAVQNFVTQHFRYGPSELTKQIEAHAKDYLKTIDLTKLNAVIDELVKKEVQSRTSKILKAL